MKIRIVRHFVSTFMIMIVLIGIHGLGQTTSNIETLLTGKTPAQMLAPLKEKMRTRVEDRFNNEVMSDAHMAQNLNRGELYPNPSFQAYVQQLGQFLLPREASADILVSFKIVEDPLPFANTLTTGTIFISTGMISLLDNESQLAFLLMHEAGHVMLSHHLSQIIEEEKAKKKKKRNKVIGALAGAAIGGAVGGDSSGAFLGGTLGTFGASFTGRFRSKRFNKKIQEESDRFAINVLLRNHYDVREAPELMAKMQNIVKKSNASVGLAFGYAKDLPTRTAKINQLLTGIYKSDVAQILDGEGFKVTSPQFQQLMSELKRDNGRLALNMDLFAMAKANLEEAAAIRTDDPVTIYYLGLLYRAVARTPEERNKAANYFKSAIKFDVKRDRFPEAYLQYAVELLNLEDTRHYPDIQHALKTYVTLYQRRSGGGLPREMPYIYDYLELTGDFEWKAYRVNNVNTKAPYQLTDISGKEIMATGSESMNNE